MVCKQRKHTVTGQFFKQRIDFLLPRVCSQRAESTSLKMRSCFSLSHTTGFLYKVLLDCHRPLGFRAIDFPCQVFNMAKLNGRFEFHGHDSRETLERNVPTGAGNDKFEPHGQF